MKAWRAQLPHLMPLIAALFVSGVAIPRPGLYFHEHAGGDRAHVHDEDIADLDHHHHHLAHHDHHEATHHHHAHHVARGATAATELEAPEPTDLGHWHSQSPFHRVVPVAHHPLIRASLIRALPAEPLGDAPDSGVRSACARAPPLLTVVS